MENGKKNILVVDDSRTVRHLLKMVISRYILCQIVEAEDGEDAARKLTEQSFDLMITDINMPRMNGLSLVSKVRSEMGMDLPIIIVTTMGKEEDRDKGLELGADFYVTKPVSGPSLLDAVSRLVTRDNREFEVER